MNAETHSDVGTARMLFQEYAASLGIDLNFQGFDNELATLPGEYAPPEGCLLLACLDRDAVGCVAVRKLDKEICEMKRLYVRPGTRGLHIGRILTTAAITKAKEMGYRVIRLDTLASMEVARLLYRSLGFREIPPYRYNPIEGAIYMELDLTQ